MLRAKYPAALLILFSHLPPPLAPVLRVISQDQSLAQQFDSSLLYHPRSFWSFQHVIPTLEQSALITRPADQVALVHLGSNSESLSFWLSQLTIALDKLGVSTDRISADTPALLDEALTYRTVIVIDKALCEGYASQWVYRALANEDRIVAYLGAPRAHFVLHNPKQLIDLRNYPDPVSFATYLAKLLSSASSSSTVDKQNQKPLDPYGYKPAGVAMEPQPYSLADALEDMAAVLAWKKLLNPLPVLAPLPVKLLDTCVGWEQFVRSFTKERFDFLSQPEGIDLLIYHAGDPFDKIGEQTWTQPASCMHKGVRSCKVTSDRGQIKQADAILLHERLSGKVGAEGEPEFDMWQPVIGYTAESAIFDHMPLFAHARRNAFSLLVGQHPTSEGVGDFSYLWQSEKIRSALQVDYETKTEFSRKRATVFWAASHCIKWRDDLVASLMNGIVVDSYGSCVNTMGRDDRSAQTFLSYKFYLSIENSVCLDYMTEKLWNPLLSGNVPVYFGAPNVFEILPTTHSVIPIDKFDSPQHLADCLQWLGQPQNRAAYEYFVEQHVNPRTKLRPGFAYHVYNTYPPCDRLQRQCGIVADHYAQILSARSSQTAFPSQRITGDRSCNRAASPTVFQRAY